MVYEFEKLDHVQLAGPPGCEAEARQFYGELLGMTELKKPESLIKRGGAWFQAGAVQLHIGIEQDFRPAKKAHPAMLVNELDALLSYLTKKGAHCQEDTDLPGAKRFYLHDPFGNRLEFLEWEESPIDEESLSEG